MGEQLSLFSEQELSAMEVSTPKYVPFVSEVEQFNETFGKPNNYAPTIPDKKEWEFVYNFILEELEEDDEFELPSPIDLAIEEFPFLDT